MSAFRITSAETIMFGVMPPISKMVFTKKFAKSCMLYSINGLMEVLFTLESNQLFFGTLASFTHFLEFC